jgi:enamine deaminase RidA (YjgF/YER057c/UK114 family)
VSSHPAAETIESHGCSIVLRRVDGPDARELFLHCQPPAHTAEARAQAEAIYRAVLDVLSTHAGGFNHVVTETLFLRSPQGTLEPVRAARQQVLAAHSGASHRPATTYIEQPPLDERACVEVSLQVLLPSAGGALRCETIAPLREHLPCHCDACAQSHGLLVLAGPDETRFHAAGLCGTRGASAYDQTLGMFGLAERLLQQAGMEFSDVVRAWIHMRDIDRDYGELNRARRDFFAARGIDPAPASTGIGGAPVTDDHDLCLGVYAVVKRDGRPTTRVVMTSPTLNEAPQYGADFVRGMRVEEANKVTLYVSGTASIDEQGRTAHVGDLDAQADRMLVNIAALLQRQGATFSDVVHAITYLKHPADAARLRGRLSSAGFEGFPHALVVAPVCRADLLCETEVIAVLRRD